MLGSLSTLFCLTVLMLRRSVIRSYDSNLLCEDLFGFIGRIAHYKSCGVTTPNSISNSIAQSHTAKTKGAFLRILRMIRLGEDFQCASMIVLASLGSPYQPISIGESHIQLQQAFNSYSEMKRSRASTALDTLQRGATINMFLSTILPSFLLFIFVGSAVLSESGGSIIAVSIALLILVPLFYAFSNAIFVRGFIEVTR
ncbi:MAG: hypothetical protein KGH77_02860 [Candidatus Micrarchaeota archaeon]|nr:hypothetical protein [Candidatus Micrarchaeota archaeon]